MPGTNHIPADSTALFNLFASFSESTLSTMYRFGIFTIVLVLLDCNTSVIRHSDDKHSIAHSLDSIGLPASVRQNATVCLPGVQVLYPLVPARSSPQNAGVQHRTLGESVPPVSFSRRPRFAAGVMKRDIERRNELRKTKDNIWFHSKINWNFLVPSWYWLILPPLEFVSGCHGIVSPLFPQSFRPLTQNEDDI